MRRRRNPPAGPSKLIVVYDPKCSLCQRCRIWMSGEPTLVDLEFMPSDAPDLEERFGDVPWAGEELVVVAENGNRQMIARPDLVARWQMVRPCRNRHGQQYRQAKRRPRQTRLLNVAKYAVRLLKHHQSLLPFSNANRPHHIEASLNAGEWRR